MNDLSNTSLLLILLGLLVLSAFFSSSETSMMSLNRYQLRHLVSKNNRTAKLVDYLLKRPDKLISAILIGNNFVNILASAIATILAIRVWGDTGIAIATITLTIIILIFAEVTPKTMAALHPKKIAFPAAYVLNPLIKVFSPLIWLVNLFTNLILKPLGVNTTNTEDKEALNPEELRTVVLESSKVIPRRHRNMLLSILDLEKVTVDDIMIPRQEISGIDISESFDQIMQALKRIQHTRILLYKNDPDHPIGILHSKKALKFITSNVEKNKAQLLQHSVEPYFVPTGTPLHTQLSHFQRVKRRLALVVNEYGDLMGLVTLEDILEEIVGEFTTDISSSINDIHPQEDGSYLIDGSANIREVNRILKWKLPTDGPKTISGLIVERLESFPTAPLCIKVEIYCIEVVQSKDNMIKTARFSLYRPPRKVNGAHSLQEGNSDEQANKH